MASAPERGKHTSWSTFLKAHWALATLQGYTLEYAVPWTALGGTAGTGRVIGFDVDVNDNDAADSVRDSQTVWHGNGWRDPSQFDQLTLKSAACP